MNWKTELQVRDLEPGQRLEMTCKTCCHVHYLTPAEIMCAPERELVETLGTSHEIKLQRISSIH